MYRNQIQFAQAESAGRENFSSSELLHDAGMCRQHVAINRQHVAIHMLISALMTLAATGIAGAGIVPGLPTVQLSAIPSELTALDPGGVLNNVHVYVCDREPYASFFLETAKVQGTMALADSLTRRFGRTLSEVASGDFEVPESDPEQWAEMVEKVAKDRDDHPDALAALQAEGSRIEAVMELAIVQGERVPSLISQIPGLTQAAPGTFKGITGKLKLVKVMMALKGSSAQLTSASASSVRTVSNLRAIVTALAPWKRTS